MKRTLIALALLVATSAIPQVEESTLDPSHIQLSAQVQAVCREGGGCVLFTRQALEDKRIEAFAAGYAAGLAVRQRGTL